MVNTFRTMRMATYLITLCHTLCYYPWIHCLLMRILSYAIVRGGAVPDFRTDC
jgi:hypothetical protein